MLTEGKKMFWLPYALLASAVSASMRSLIVANFSTKPRAFLGVAGQGQGLPLGSCHLPNVDHSRSHRTGCCTSHCECCRSATKRMILSLALLVVCELQQHYHCSAAGQTICWQMAYTSRTWTCRMTGNATLVDKEMLYSSGKRTL